MSNQKPVKDEQQRWSKPFPPRDALVRAEQLLTRFRFECEEAGWWPGAIGVPGLREYTGALGLAWELRRWHHGLLEACRQRHADKLIVYVAKHDPNEYFVPFSNQVGAHWWPSFWAIEIEHVCHTIQTLISRVLQQWEPHIGSGSTSTMAEYEYAGDEPDDEDDEVDHKNAGFVSGSHRLYLPPKVRDNVAFVLSAELAASIARCVLRLRVILASGPQTDFVPSVREQQILDALDGRAMILDDLAAHLNTDRTTLCKTELKNLQELGFVKNQRNRGGYYRPDSPPNRPPK